MSDFAVLGLAITTSSVIACFNLPFHAYGTNVGLIYLFSCFIGLFLIADSDRFENAIQQLLERGLPAKTSALAPQNLRSSHATSTTT